MYSVLIADEAGYNEILIIREGERIMPSVIKVKGTEASITTADNIGTATLVRLYNASAAGILITHKKRFRHYWYIYSRSWAIIL